MDCVINNIIDAHYFIASVGDVEQLGGVVAEDQLLPLLGHLLSRPAWWHGEKGKHCQQEQPGQAVDEVRKAPLLATADGQEGKPPSYPTCTITRSLAITLRLVIPEKWFWLQISAQSMLA